MLLRSIVVLLLMLLTFTSSIKAQGNDPEAISLATTFTYQGYIEQNAVPVTGSCDFQFNLFDALTSGTNFSTLIRTGVVVTSGVFNVQLNFGGSVFTGQDRYLAISARCPAGTGAYTALDPRQPIMPVPYAIALYGLRTQTNATSPNILGGFEGNGLTAGVAGGTISGGGSTGEANRVTDNYGTVGGGSDNQAGDGAGTTADTSFAVVGGGLGNIASGSYAVVAGGQSNTTSGNIAIVGGGYSNTASGSAAVIGGGQNNIASNSYATIGGGENNQATSNNATVGGGFTNTASGEYSSIPGGASNTASGDFSFAAGNGAVADDAGAFVWGDSSPVYVHAPAVNTFTARASGGVYFFSNSTLTAGVQLAPGGGSWSSISDRNMKDNLDSVDGRAVLDALVALPVSTWNYISQDDAIRHIGVMAQDFYAAFGVGEDDRHITSIDADGVAFAAIQGLNAKLESENAALHAALGEVRTRLATLEGLASGGQSASLLPLAVFAGVGLLGLILRRGK